MSDIIAENGYVIIAVNPIEYRQAQCCAFSIKSKMKNASVTMVVNDATKVAEKYKEGFDSIVKLPFKEYTDNRQADWQLYWASPYENTIAIDCKSIVKEDHTNTWEYLIDHYDIVFPTNTNDFRNNKLYPKYQRNIREEYKLDIIYSNMFFFKKTSESLAHFKMADVYFQYWRDVCNKYFNAHHVPDKFEPDVMHTLVANHVGNDVTSYHSMLSYIDMQHSVTAGDFGKITNWTDIINVWSSEAGKIKIQNYAMNSTLYYHENEFLTEEIFNEQQSYYRLVTK